MGDCCEFECEECGEPVSTTWRVKGKTVCYECRLELALWAYGGTNFRCIGSTGIGPKELREGHEAFTALGGKIKD